MNTNLLFDFSVNKENKSIHIQREFNAEQSLVWKAWTTAEWLDQWWAPKPWKAETKLLNFREGGYWLYAMVGPQGEKHWSRAEYISIQDQKYFKSTDFFCDEQGTKNTSFPSSIWENSFVPQNNKTQVKIFIQFDNLSDLEKLVEMGFKEGLSMAMQNLDNLLPAIKK